MMKSMKRQSKQHTLGAQLLFSFLALVYTFTPILSSQRAHALPPLTKDGFDSIVIGEEYRDDGSMRKQSCKVGAFIDAGQNGETVWRFFADKLPAHQIAGIIGNMQHESGILPQRLQGTSATTITPAESLSGEARSRAGLGWGLVQWTPPGKMINTFPNPASANSMENQLAFLWDQLQGNTTSPEGNAGRELKKTTNAADAAKVFMLKYERPAAESIAKSMDSRIKAAEAAMVRYQDIPTVASPVDPPTDASGAPINVGFSSYDNACDNSQQTSLVEVAEQQERTGGGEFYKDEAIGDGNSAEFVSWSLNKIGRPIVSGGTAAAPWLIPTVPALVDYFNNSPDYTFVYANVGKPISGDIAYFKTGDSETVAIVIDYDAASETMTYITTGPNQTMRKVTGASTEMGSNGLVGYFREVGLGDSDAANNGGTVDALPTPLPGGCITDGGYINNKVGECVGVQSGTQLSIYNNNTNPAVEVSLSNVTLNNVIIYGCVNAGSNVVIKNSKIICFRSRDITWGSRQCTSNNCEGFDGAFSSSGPNNLVERSDVYCAQNEQGDLPVNVAPCDFAFSGNGFTARYNDIKLAVDAFYPTGNNIIEYNYIHNLSNVLEEWLPIDLTDGNTDRYSHTDGMQMNTPNASSIIIRGNYMVGWNATNGLQAMLIQQPSAAPVQILNNRLEGAWAGLRISCVSGATCIINNNIIDAAYKAGSGKAIWSNNSASTIQGNTFDDGSPVEEIHICRTSGFC